MSTQRPTNSKSCARLLLKNLYLKVGETGQKITPLEYGQVANQIGLSPQETASALRHLKDELLIAYPNTSTEIIVLTRSGVERADYLRFRQEHSLLGDPLPHSLEDVQAEIRFWAPERIKVYPKSDEWRQIDARIDDLKHLENTMSKPQPNQSTAPVIHGDQINNYGQAGALGRYAKGTIDYQQQWTTIEDQIDFGALVRELEQIRSELQRSALSRSQCVQLGILAEAEGHAEKHEGSKILETLSRAGVGLLGIAKEIGTDVAAKVLAKSLGLQP